MAKNVVKTPLMRQYYQIKAKHPDAILLFRVGDFYETFSEDAILTSKILGITLTKRANGSASYVELAGFPYHAIDTYLPKLVRAGQRVAICEQLEDPKATKKLVKRGVTELVTPGVSLNDNLIENKENNFLAGLVLSKELAGIAFLDISTGEFMLSEGNIDYIEKLINSLQPKEILYERSFKKEIEERFANKFYTYPVDEWMFVYDSAYERLLKQFETPTLKGFGVENYRLGLSAAGAILHYLDITQHHQTKHITNLSRIDKEKYVWLDKFTIRNLEIFKPMHEKGKALIDIIDTTKTPMGSRLLKQWLALPLKNVNPINKRLEMVEHLINTEHFRLKLAAYIKEIGDLERLASKVSTGKISPREMIQLKNSLNAIIPIIEACNDMGNNHFKSVAEHLNPIDEIRNRIEQQINNDPPAQVQKGNVIAPGVNQELDELRELSSSGKTYLAQMQEKQAKLTGIASLKIGYNNVFGYYFEVRNTYKNRVPSDWIRKQTLVSAERYINQELKEYEAKILGAEEKILTLETKLYNDLVLAVSKYIEILQKNARIIASLDILVSFSENALTNNYNRPFIDESDKIEIKKGRHPVIETQLPLGESYVPNDIKLDTRNQQIIIITGPNMAGKSALLRQTALIVLMAQIGSYVPAEQAEIGYVDKIFTRVGASDNISLGESTFMVEMNEAASILNNLSHRSLVLFDELGRGTSTYDGISIAWSIVEYIHEYHKGRAKTLFATHYHELNEMEKSFKRIKNYNVSVREIDNKIIFLRKLVPGGSEHSFGIHVAKMAGMPKSVVKRANEILSELEGKREENQLAKPVQELGQNREGYQLSMFQLDDPVLKQIRDEIKQLDINNLTPIDALNKLNEIKKIVGLK